MSEPRYPFLHVDVSAEEADEAGAYLFELGAQGVEERDGMTLSKSTGLGIVTLVAAFADRVAAEAALAEVDASWSPRIEEIVGDAWRDAWKEHYHPFALTPRITVRPPWEEHAPTRDDERVLELEPGRAFGTGLHATTSLVARVLDREAARFSGKVVLDVGTGSGILALVALVLGAVKVVAVDVDPEAVAVTRENATRNGLADRVEASTTDIADIPGTFPVVVANIEARVLVPLAEELGARVDAGGLLVLSGILAGQEDDVQKAYASFSLIATEREGEWVSLCLVR